jgi:hypothetical protein
LPGSVSDGARVPLAPVLAPGPENPPSDADLVRLTEAWPNLPAHIRAAVLALVNSARP